MKLIAYESLLGAPFRPYIPGTYYTYDGSVYNKITKIGSYIVGNTEFNKLMNLNFITKIESTTVEKNKWPCIEQSEKVVWFSVENEDAWRLERAKSLISLSTSLKPVESIRMLTACAHLMKMNLLALMSELEQNRKNPKESFETIFRRIKKK